MHKVVFYQKPEQLMEILRPHIIPALERASPIIVVATRLNLRAIEHYIASLDFDIEVLRSAGVLATYDAEECLERFFVAGSLCPERCRQTITAVLDAAEKGRVSYPAISLSDADHRYSNSHDYIRAYGEMVDVLWLQGKIDEAIQLERIWNEVEAERNLDLLCGYQADIWNRSSHADVVMKACQEHQIVQFPSAEAEKSRKLRCTLRARFGVAGDTLWQQATVNDRRVPAAYKIINWVRENSPETAEALALSFASDA